MRRWIGSAIASIAVSLVLSCGNSQPASIAAHASAGRVVTICPGDDAQRKALVALFDAREGDVLEFCAGRFDFTTGLILASTRGVTLRGAGIDKTVLSFKNSNSKEGILASHVEGLTVQDLTVIDSPGDGVKVSDSRFVTLKRVKVTWSNVEPDSPSYDASQESWAQNGAYAFYPVLTTDLVVEECIARGSSDVGFYVGQSQRVIVRDNVAEWNVQGYEFENTDDSEMHGNLATNNAGGFLAVDLPGRTRFGDKNRFYENRIVDNNIDNFAPRGTIAAAVPRGTGMIVLATDQVEIFDNEFRNNDTLGLVIVAYKLIDSSKDPRYDYYAEGTQIHDNVFADNGRNPQLPVIDLPTVIADPQGITGNPSLLPALIAAKNLGQTAHIVWDGYVDTLNPDCPAPEGVPTDERGKPQYGPDDEASDCGQNEKGIPIRYNAYKFDDQGNLKLPENGLCIHDNRFEDTLLPTPHFTNFHGTEAELASRDETPHACQLPLLPPTIVQPYVPGSGSAAQPSDEEIARVCSSVKPGQINRAALPYNCPRLSQYGLFSDPEDPRSTPNEGGEAYDLVTPLFSDYALKYRVILMPPGQSAAWRDHESGPNAALQFPAGTVIAKTFAFRKGDTENVVETRLLIKRETSTGVFWQGLPYLWRDENGHRDATLEVAGATAAVQWDYDDPNPDARSAAGLHPHYAGSTDHYVIPQANQCITCHQREDVESGAFPIGPKPRNLNRDYGDGGNQLARWCREGFIVGCPADLSKAEKLATWNVPGSSGEMPDSDADVEARARAYLEANCSHCHTPKGVAKSTRLSLDQWTISEGTVAPRPVNRDYGICKPPVASGRGTGDREYDIVPGAPDDSIMDYRLNNADDVAVRMPPISRSVRHDEGYALIREWITRMPLPTTEDDNCSGPVGLPIPKALRRP